MGPVSAKRKELVGKIGLGVKMETKCCPLRPSYSADRSASWQSLCIARAFVCCVWKVWSTKTCSSARGQIKESQLTIHRLQRTSLTKSTNAALLLQQQIKCTLCVAKNCCTWRWRRRRRHHLLVTLKEVLDHSLAFYFEKCFNLVNLLYCFGSCNCCSPALCCLYQETSNALT